MTQAVVADSVPAPSPAAAGRPAAAGPLMAALAVGLFAAALWQFTRGADLPAAYHPDEPGKGLQVLQGRRNYRHPQLLLELSTLLAIVRGDRSGGPPRAGPEDPVVTRAVQRVVETGRDVSAALAAAGVAVLALVAGRTGGWPAMLLCGAGLLFSGPLLVNAHFMKEDTALVFGLAVVALAARLAWERRDAGPAARVRSARWLGAACAVAVSGKYVGVVAVLPALYVLLARASDTIDPAAVPPRRRLPNAFGTGLAVAFLLINWRVLNGVGSFAKAVGGQAVVGVVEHKGLTMAKPTAYFLHAFVASVPAYVLAAATGAAAVGVVRLVRRGDRWAAALGLAPFAFLALVSFSSAANHRYALPAVVLAHLSAAVFSAAALRAVLPRRAWGPAAATAAGAVLAAGVVWTERPRVAVLIDQFARDSRIAVAAWAGTLPPGAVVLQDAMAELHVAPELNDPDDPTVPTRTPAGDAFGYAPEYADLDALPALGVTHVAVCDLAYARYFDPYVVPTPDYRREHARVRRWYERLFREGELVWRSVPSVPTHAPVNPEVRVYRVRSRAGGAADPAP